MFAHLSAVALAAGTVFYAPWLAASVLGPELTRGAHLSFEPALWQFRLAGLIVGEVVLAMVTISVLLAQPYNIRLAVGGGPSRAVLQP